MVFRVYTEKKPSFDHEAHRVRHEIRAMGIPCSGVRLLNRYDVEGVDRDLFDRCVPAVFSEPPVDRVFETLPATDGWVLIVEALPGQFDQRADSAAQCVQLISRGVRPFVRSAKVYLVEGPLSEADREAVRHLLINPVESRETDDTLPDTLAMDAPVPPAVPVLDGFRAMDAAGLDGVRLFDDALPVIDALGDSGVRQVVISATEHRLLCRQVARYDLPGRFESVLGSENNDEYCIENGKVRTCTNHAGGILGGITNGEEIVFRVAFKPTPSIAKPQRSVNLESMQPESLEITGRHDPWSVPRAVPVVEAVAAVALSDLILRGNDT